MKRSGVLMAVAICLSWQAVEGAKQPDPGCARASDAVVGALPDTDVAFQPRPAKISTRNAEDGSEVVVSVDFTGNGGSQSWRGRDSNHYLARIFYAAERLAKSEGDKLEFSFEVRSDSQGELTVRGSKEKRDALLAAIAADDLPQPPANVVMVPLSRLRFTQDYVRRADVEAKRRTQNDPTPVYSIRVPPGRQVLVVMDGHHRALSYLDGTGEARNVFVPVEFWTLEQVNAHFNRQTPDAPTNYPREVVELMLLDSMIPQGKIPRIVEEFPRRR